MCRVTVEVDQEVLMGVDPTLDNAAALRKWVQELVNHRTRELVAEDKETMDIEDARAIIHETIRREYARI